MGELCDGIGGWEIFAPELIDVGTLCHVSSKVHAGLTLCNDSMIMFPFLEFHCVILRLFQ